MKKILFFICVCIGIIGIARADNATINWYVGDSVYDTTTCTIGGDINLPTAPNVPGHTFLGWKPLYTQIEYLESTGTQYIDTGFKPNQDSGMIIDFYAIRSELPSIAMVANRDNSLASFGVAENTSGATSAMLLYNGRNATDYYWRVYKSMVYGEGTGRYVVDINKQNLNITASNGSILTNTIESYNYQMPITLWLFSTHSSDGANILSPNVRIYSCKLYDNGTLVRDFIPVLDKNGVPCMYDKVSETFFYNSGTGDFIAGPIITE